MAMIAGFFDRSACAAHVQVRALRVSAGAEGLAADKSYDKDDNLPQKAVAKFNVRDADWLDRKVPDTFEHFKKDEINSPR